MIDAMQDQNQPGLIVRKRQVGGWLTGVSYQDPPPSTVPLNCTCSVCIAWVHLMLQYGHTPCCTKCMHVFCTLHAPEEAQLD